MKVNTTQQNIPSGWIITALGSLATKLKTGGTPTSTNKDFYGGNIPFVKIDDMTTSGKYLSLTKNYISENGLKNSSAWLVPKDSILYSIYATVGEVSINSIEVATNQAIMGIVVDEKEADRDYLFQYLLSIKPTLNKHFKETTQKNLTSQVVRELEILIPKSKKEQQKIAEILGTVDEYITKTQEVIEATEKLKRGLMQQLFTRGIGHTKFKETESGEIPAGWEVKELKDVSTKIGDGLHGTPEYSEDSEFYFINGNNISEKVIKIYPETKKISVEEHQLHKKDLTERSILLSINGTIGNIGFYMGEKVVLGKSVAYINCDNKVNKEFIAYQLETERIYKHFTKELTGTTIKNLSLGTIRQTPVFVAEVAEQKKIAEILSAVDEKISINKKLKEKLTLLKKGLMQDLLSGNLRVNV